MAISIWRDLLASSKRDLLKAMKPCMSFAPDRTLCVLKLCCSAVVSDLHSALSLYVLRAIVCIRMSATPDR